jgi:hypothetical protein
MLCITFDKFALHDQIFHENDYWSLQVLPLMALLARARLWLQLDDIVCLPMFP